MKNNSRAGFSSVELVVVIAIVAILAAISFQQGGEVLARQRLESSTRRLAIGIERGRLAAQRKGEPCGLSLGPTGWQVPLDGSATCLGARLGLGEGVADAGRNDAGRNDAGVTVSHNLPAVLRFTPNGLVLDAGTVVLTTSGTQLRRCLVIALPLGIVRLGRYGADPTKNLKPEACLPDRT
ncbi:GspH/FimT family pseudopilin [Cyanobium sp. HWJ4-Hawea]|uniref:GspH/FimT family protein n=1 Tax=Cyanobium sp. HWJ4-Hawea TaxID=2823713 RepID=UPI0020CC5FC2|nr:GspH/FimT family protein [Cyanobium sp. HWJ4-Hawea]MCP9807943.1 GspH/FimT family pseudopilin [Cyanobium sp. HWJ4-Hawea]